MEGAEEPLCWGPCCKRHGCSRSILQANNVRSNHRSHRSCNSTAHLPAVERQNVAGGRGASWESGKDLRWCNSLGSGWQFETRRASCNTFV